MLCHAAATTAAASAAVGTKVGVVVPQARTANVRDECVIDIRRVRYNYAIYIQVLFLSLLLLLFRIEGALPEAQDGLAPTSLACRMGYGLGLGAKRELIASAKWQRYRSVGN